MSKPIFLLGIMLLGTGDYGAGRESAWWFIAAAAGAFLAGIGYERGRFDG